MIEKRWLTKPEAQDYTGLGEKAFRKLRRQVPPHKISFLGRRGLRWDRLELDAWMERQPREAAPELPRTAGTRPAPRFAGMTQEEILSRAGYGGRS